MSVPDGILILSTWTCWATTHEGFRIRARIKGRTEHGGLLVAPAPTEQRDMNLPDLVQVNLHSLSPRGRNWPKGRLHYDYSLQDLPLINSQ